ncbi:MULTISPECIES: DUF3383 family protein [unclassified Aurantimonas]|uniref:DUF3383 family protein n=1 Tax=unclassified Aurantimonas TaxID=2638230 RepID=UPI002E19849D|nr:MULTISPECIES: DUF3383 family protein [unclassified Aurantimonas]MEC5289385.1 DUF3383 family protein [Aurantimonas sp. C2-3-R2]MEC5410465.1 DUF3383 family protein [Aurantimonas sp. C2-4-R8]
MAKLPISRFVNVDLTREDRFPTIEGFGIALLLTSQTVVGKLDASNLTRTYGSMAEVAVDFAAGDQFYQAALLAFSQNPSPLQVKAGWYNTTTYTAALTDPLKNGVISDALDAIEDADDGWYFIDVETALRDIAGADAVIEWTEARRKQAMLTSNDIGHETVSDVANISARHKGDFERTNIFYHTDATKHPGFAYAAKLGTFNFDEEGAAYTGKFKRLNGLDSINKGSAVVQAITGFVPSLGQDMASGHMANTYVDTKGVNLVVEGSTLTANVFTDEIHAGDWLSARMEEEVFAAMLNNKRIAMDPNGMRILAGAAEAVMVRARRAGIVADYEDENGEFVPAFTVTPGDVDSISAAQRKARIAPATQVVFRYSGAVHFAVISITMRF